MGLEQTKYFKSNIKKLDQKGQAIIEYILLLVFILAVGGIVFVCFNHRRKH